MTITTGYAPPVESGLGLRSHVANGYHLGDTGRCAAAWWCERHDAFDENGGLTLVEHTRRIAEMSIDQDEKILEVVVAWAELLGAGAAPTHPHAAIWVYEHGNREVISLSAHLTGGWVAGELADVLKLLGEGRWLADALHSAHALLCVIDFRRRQAEKAAQDQKPPVNGTRTVRAGASLRPAHT